MRNAGYHLVSPKTLIGVSMWTWLLTARLLVMLFVALILNACAAIYHPFYPEKWEARPSVAENECMDIAGNYDIDGEDGKGKPSIALTYFFWSGFSPRRWKESRLDEVYRVKIEQSTGIIKISAWKQDEKIAEKELRRQGKLDRTSYLCTPDGIMVEGAGLPVHSLAGVILQKLMLFKLSDNSLVLKHTDTGGGLALVIPAFVSVSEWNRYKQYTGQPQQQELTTDHNGQDIDTEHSWIRIIPRGSVTRVR